MIIVVGLIFVLGWHVLLRACPTSAALPDNSWGKAERSHCRFGERSGQTDKLPRLVDRIRS